MRLLLLGLLFIANVYAADEPVRFDDPTRAALYDSMLEEIRCLVCQNQSLADSNAELAQDLRNEIITMIRSDKTEADIKAFLVERYGDFVLYRPPMQENTWLLWLGPFLFLAAGIAVAIITIRRQSTHVAEPVQLSAEQEQALRALDNDSDRETT